MSVSSSLRPLFYELICLPSPLRPHYYALALVTSPLCLCPRPCVLALIPSPSCLRPYALTFMSPSVCLHVGTLSFMPSPLCTRLRLSVSAPQHTHTNPFIPASTHPHHFLSDIKKHDVWGNFPGHRTKNILYMTIFVSSFAFFCLNILPEPHTSPY